jgi:hypothetical protein
VELLLCLFAAADFAFRNIHPADLMFLQRFLRVVVEFKSIDDRPSLLTPSSFVD